VFVCIGGVGGLKDCFELRFDGIYMVISKGWVLVMC